MKVITELDGTRFYMLFSVHPAYWDRVMHKKADSDPSLSLDELCHYTAKSIFNENEDNESDSITRWIKEQNTPITFTSNIDAVNVNVYVTFLDPTVETMFVLRWS